MFTLKSKSIYYFIKNGVLLNISVIKQGPEKAERRAAVL